MADTNPEQLSQAIMEFYNTRDESLRKEVQSSLNRLQERLALLILKCVPDIWSEPFRELCELWTSQQELLLRILAEVASEYNRLNMGWKAKRILKTELNKVSADIVKIAHAALADPESSPSVKNAAVECIESWLKLPGSKVTDFLEALTSLFDNVSNDIVALTRILCTLRSNDDLPNLPRLVKQITQFIVMTVCPMIINEINNVITSEVYDPAEQLGDIIPLICAVAEFCHGFIRQIVISAVDSSDTEFVNTYFALCMFFTQLSTIDGIYPCKECISDLPETFWSALREELTHADDDKPFAENKKILCTESAKFFTQILHSSISKIAYLPEVEAACDKSQMEQFDSYRITRGDVSSNALQIAPIDTLNILTGSLDTFLQQRDIYRAEAVLYYMKEAADFLTGDNFNAIAPSICRCGAFLDSFDHKERSLVRYGTTLMELLQQVEHLVILSSNVNHLLPEIIKIVLNFFNVPGLDAKCIDTLAVFLKKREIALEMVLDPIISSCYAYFQNELNPADTRINAIRCIGLGLSLRPSDFILNSLDQILSPRLISLKETLCVSSLVASEQQKEKVIFELSVLEQLVGTLEANKASDDCQESRSPIQMIISQCIPIFDVLLSHSDTSSEIVGRICDVLRAGAVSLQLPLLSTFLESYINYLNVLIFKNPSPACEVAKMVFFAYRADTQYAPLLVQCLSNWYVKHSTELSQNETLAVAELDENMLELAYHVLRKCWKMLTNATTHSEMMAQETQKFIQSLCWIAVKVIERSREVAKVKESFRTLLVVVKNCTESDNIIVRQSLESVADNIITISFLSIKSELVTPFATCIAEVLYSFAKAYPSQTRSAILKLPGGDSQQTKVLFSQTLSLKNFKFFVNEVHQSALKGIS
ncbi:exportin 1-like protein [Ditylenchus destructor]|nr:exportin 1-like protein [Ditylenchus destructor]